jgi:hypothetical protein
MPSLKQAEHQSIQKLILEFLSGDDRLGKNVSIRDDMQDLLKPYVLQWRLHPDQVGIHPANRDNLKITSQGCVLRGKKVLPSGFSFKAIGELWAFEDHPTGAIGKYTNEVLVGDQGFAPPCESIKVGPANWTHTNQFVRMVQHCAPCSDPDIPTKDGKIDKAAIMADPKNSKMFSYINEGMLFNVIPYWIEEQYPTVPNVFQSAANQEMQVQTGRLA